MTAIDQLLARARLHSQPNVPDDTVPYEDTPYPADPPAPQYPSQPSLRHQAAAHHLTTLCETAIATVTEKSLTFLNDQMPDLHSAWLLGCALHIAGIPEGARFWWQYAAGDHHAPACYSLSLYHEACGEQYAADFYRQQAHRVTTASDTDTLTVVGTSPADDQLRRQPPHRPAHPQPALRRPRNPSAKAPPHRRADELRCRHRHSALHP
ncbi:hypothetical protein ACFQZ0_00335 [Streptomyces erythrogriseus]